MIMEPMDSSTLIPNATGTGPLRSWDSLLKKKKKSIHETDEKGKKHTWQLWYKKKSWSVQFLSIVCNLLFFGSLLHVVWLVKMIFFYVLWDDCSGDHLLRKSWLGLRKKGWIMSMICTKPIIVLNLDDYHRKSAQWSKHLNCINFH